MISEVNQTQKDKYCMILFICGTLNSPTHRSREENGGCQGLGEGNWRDVCQMVQSFSYARWVWRAHVQPGGYS